MNIARKHAKSTYDSWEISFDEDQLKLMPSFEELLLEKYLDELKFERLNVQWTEKYLVPMLEEEGAIKPKIKKLDGNFLFITLRPSDEHKERFSEFRHIVEKDYLKRRMFINGTYCWEQKGENEADLGKGYHIHILALCRAGLMKTQCIKDTKSTFKKFLKGDVPEAFVEVKYVRDTDDYKKIETYMKGFKADEEKQNAVSLDPLFRKSYGLAELYTFTNVS